MGEGGGFLGGIDSRIRIVIAVVAVLSFVLILFLFRSCGKKDPNAGYTVIYSHLDLKDAAGVITQLKALKIPFQIRENGTSVAVLKEKADEARLGLAEKNLPTGGSVGWEIFDQSRLGTTDFDRRIQFVRAVSGELARTIKRIEAVDDARVQIVIPQTSLFEAAKAPVTASVLLQIRKGRELTNQQIVGIIRLVANSVENLRPENVTIVDVFGNMLSSGALEKEATREAASETKEGLAIEVPIFGTLEAGISLLAPPITISTKEGQALSTIEGKAAGTKEAVSVQVPIKRALTAEEKILSSLKAKEELENLFSSKIQKLVNNFYPPNSILVKATVDIEEVPVIIQKEILPKPIFKRVYRNKRYYRIKVIPKKKMFVKAASKTEKKEKIKKVSVIVLVDNRFALTDSIRNATLNTISNAVSYNKARGDRITLAQVPFHYATEYSGPEKKAGAKIPIKEGGSLRDKVAGVLGRTFFLASIGAIALIGLGVFAARKILAGRKEAAFGQPIEKEPPFASKTKEEIGKKTQIISDMRAYVAQSPEKIAELLKKWLSEEEAA